MSQWQTVVSATLNGNGLGECPRDWAKGWLIFYKWLTGLIILTPVRLQTGIFPKRNLTACRLKKIISRQPAVGRVLSFSVGVSSSEVIQHRYVVFLCASPIDFNTAGTKARFTDVATLSFLGSASHGEFSEERKVWRTKKRKHSSNLKKIIISKLTMSLDSIMYSWQLISL